MNEHYLIIGASLLVIFSYFCNIFAQKTSVPSVLLLMAAGMVLSHFLPFETGSLRNILEVLGTVGLILIVLEAALDLKLTREKGSLLWRSCALALILLLATSSLIAFFLYFWMGIPYYTALIYSVPLSVMSSAIVIPSTGGLAEKKKEFMIFESSFSDIFGIMIFYFLIDLRHHDSPQAITLEILLNILITVVVSLLISYLLISLFQRIKSEVKLFLLIASLLVLYSTGKLMHLSSLVTILTFGVVLNNYQLFFKGPLRRMIIPERIDGILDNFRFITMETAFVFRTFFFVIFGMSVSVSQLYDPVALMLTAFILIGTYLLRFGGLKFLGEKNISPEVFITPRGLITILLFFAIPPDLRAEQFNHGIVLTIILATSLIMTFALIRYRTKAQTDAEEEAEVPATQEKE